MSAPNSGWLLRYAAILAILPGCDPTSRDGLVIATAWPPDDRSRIAQGFEDWLASSGRSPVRIHWTILDPGDDLSAMAVRRHPPDLLLGAPARDLDRLTRSGRLAPLPITGSPAWAIAREETLKTTPVGQGLPFADPRRDPIAIAWAESLLVQDRFATGYARLVREAGMNHRIRRRPGAPAAAVSRDELDRPVAFEPDGKGTIRWMQGVAIVAGTRHPEEARLFVEFLAATGAARPNSPAPNRRSEASLELLADLLGATLVDAQDELHAAWNVLEKAGSPAAQLHALTEPPPWPPASIAKILDREGEPAMAMIEALAGQIATEPASRAWLVKSWLRPRRTIDFLTLDELSRANDGRLYREPRFRDWLRAEWTAWARQRYRRVVRVIENARASVAATSP